MATVSNGPSAVSNASGSTLAITGVTATIGDFLVLAVAADNNGTAGASSTSASITDPAGNTWTRRSETNRTAAGVAADGITLSIWTCPVTVALSSATITVNFSPNTTAKAALIKKIAPAAGETIVYRSAGSGASGSDTSFSTGTVAGVPLGDTILGFCGLQARVNPTPDSDTTNGSWSSNFIAIADSGTVGTSVLVYGQHKTVTATGDQSWDTSFGSARQYALNYIAVYVSTSGTVAATDAIDAASFAGPVATTGALGATDGADTASLAGLVGIVGAMAAAGPQDIARFIAPTSAPRAGTKSVRILVRIDWPDDQVSRYWIGDGAVIDADGEEWRGAGLITGFDALERAVNRESPGMTLALNGVTAEPAGRIWDYHKAGNLIDAQIRWLLQSCDDLDQPQGAPRIIFTGYFANVTFDDTGGETPTSMISVDVINKFQLRRAQNWAVLSDADQKARSAVINPEASPDRFAERMSLLENKTVVWPRF